MVKTMYIKIFHSVYTAVLAYELRHLRAATHIYIGIRQLC